MHLLTGVRYPLRSVFVQHSDLGTLRKRLLKRAARNVNAIMICILLLAVCMFVRNSLLLDRDSTTFSESPFKTEIFYRVPEFNTSSLKAPSDSLGFQELMENTDDGWLRYYQDRRDELSGMSPMQIMCAYRCWNDWRCLGFVFREALWHMCNLIRYTQTRCYEPPDDIEQPEASAVFALLPSALLCTASGRSQKAQIFGRRRLGRRFHSRTSRYRLRTRETR